MAAATFQWNPDGSGIIVVNGHTYHVNGQQPGTTIYVGGEKVIVPAKPVQPAAVQPYLDPVQMQQFIEQTAGFDQTLQDANLSLKQAGIQLNDLDLPQINLRSKQGVESTAETMAGRGISFSGIRDSAMLDVERARSMAETAARSNFQMAQDRFDATTAQINAAKARQANMKIAVSGENARRDNVDIPPVASTPQPLQSVKAGQGVPGAVAPPAAPKPAPVVKRPTGGRPVSPPPKVQTGGVSYGTAKKVSKTIKAPKVRM